MINFINLAREEQVVANVVACDNTLRNIVHDSLINTPCLVINYSLYEPVSSVDPAQKPM